MIKTTVTKEEYDKFIKEYPRKLDRSVLNFFEPPVEAYHDFTIGVRKRTKIFYL